MKILGFALITLSSALCGFVYSAGRSEHAETLHSFFIMLEILQAEIMDKLSPLPELAHYLSERIEGRAGSFLSVLSFNLSLLGQKDFETIWCESLYACVPELGEKETEAIASLGKTLGRYDARTQHVAIGEVLEYLSASMEKERAELPQLRKLSMGVSVSVGALLAVLLV